MTRWQVFDQLCGILRARLRGTPPQLPADLLWEQFIQASSYHCITPFLAWSLQGHQELDREVRDYLAAILALNTQRNQQLTGVIGRVAGALNAIDIVPVFFKGAAYSAGTLYPEPGLRFTGDIDLLLPAGRAQDISKALTTAGFEAEEARLLVRMTQPYLPHFRDAVTGATLDTHREIAPQQWHSIVEPDGFDARCRLVELGGAQVRIPHPTDLVAHSIVHNRLKDRYHERGSVQLRQLLDLAFLCDRHSREIDWVDLENRFEKTATASVLSTNLHFVEALLHRDVPKFKCPPRRDALELLRTMIEHPRYQRQFLMTGWLSQYAAQLKAQPLSALNLLNPNTFGPRLQRLRSILQGKKW